MTKYQFCPSYSPNLINSLALERKSPRIFAFFPDSSYWKNSNNMAHKTLINCCAKRCFGDATCHGFGWFM